MSQRTGGNRGGEKGECPHMADARHQLRTQIGTDQETAEITRTEQAERGVIETLQRAAQRQQRIQQTYAEQQQHRAAEQGGQFQKHRKHGLTRLQRLLGALLACGGAGPA
jgi:queuine/archaeosine tRNA-ribosyltransferase